jgi:hypothetical protein
MTLGKRECCWEKKIRTTKNTPKKGFYEETKIIPMGEAWQMRGRVATERYTEVYPENDNGNTIWKN